MSVNIYNASSQELVQVASSNLTNSEDVETLNEIKASVAADKASVTADRLDVMNMKSSINADMDKLKSELESVTVLTDEVSSLKSDLDLQSSILLRTSPNLIDMDAKVEKSIDENGKVLTNTRTWAWLNIPVNGGDKLVLSTNRLGTYDCFYVFSYNDDGYIADSKGYLTDFFNGTESGNYTKI